MRLAKQPRPRNETQPADPSDPATSINSAGHNVNEISQRALPAAFPRLPSMPLSFGGHLQLIDIMEQAIEPWLKSNGYLS